MKHSRYNLCKISINKMSVKLLEASLYFFILFLKKTCFKLQLHFNHERTYCSAEIIRKVNKLMLVPPVRTKFLTTDFIFHSMFACIPAKVQHSTGNYLFVTSVDQLKRELRERPYSKWYYTQPAVDIFVVRQRALWDTSHCSRKYHIKILPRIM